MKAETTIDRTDGGTGRINKINLYIDGQRVKTIILAGNEAHIYNGDSTLDRVDKPKIKSASCSHVLALMDADMDYESAVNEALWTFPVTREQLEKELNLYI
jgi:hypothetical protein